MRLWEDRARLENAGDLQKVLDPADTKGIKNAYIDFYLKHYLMAKLKPNSNDVVLEIGSGVGRLVEYFSCFVKNAYGIDLIDKFVDDCNASPSKNTNTWYYKIGEVNLLSGLGIGKGYIVWVLMYFSKDEDAISTLLEYNKKLRVGHSMYVIEQVKTNDETELLAGSFYCKYRTIENYYRIFEASGYSVEECIVLGERRLGFFFKLLFSRKGIYKMLPTAFRFISPIFFYCDKYLLNMVGPQRRAADTVPTDVLFSLKSKLG